MQATLIVDLALTVLEKVLPSIMMGIRSGEISVEYQVKLAQRIKNLRPENGGFTGPEWEQSGIPTPNMPIDPSKDVTAPKP